jgi:hypothetical protein
VNSYNINKPRGSYFLDSPKFLTTLKLGELYMTKAKAVNGTNNVPETTNVSKIGNPVNLGGGGGLR